MTKQKLYCDTLKNKKENKKEEERRREKCINTDVCNFRDVIVCYIKGTHTAPSLLGDSRPSSSSSSSSSSLVVVVLVESPREVGLGGERCGKCAASLPSTVHTRLPSPHPNALPALPRLSVPPAPAGIGGGFWMFYGKRMCQRLCRQLYLCL